MQKQIKGLEQFQKTFNGPCHYEPCQISEEDYKLRYDLLKEENEEYLQACKDENEVEILDALTDQLFLVIGNFVAHGMQHIAEDAFAEVLRSNMSKTDENGKPIINGENGVLDNTRPLGKVLKSDRYSEPNLYPILKSGKGKSARVINLAMEMDGIKTRLRLDHDAVTEAHLRTRITEINRELEELTGKTI